MVLRKDGEDGVASLNGHGDEKDGEVEEKKG